MLVLIVLRKGLLNQLHFESLQVLMKCTNTLIKVKISSKSKNIVQLKCLLMLTKTQIN